MFVPGQNYAKFGDGIGQSSARKADSYISHVLRSISKREFRSKTEATFALCGSRHLWFSDLTGSGFSKFTVWQISMQSAKNVRQSYLWLK